MGTGFGQLTHIARIAMRSRMCTQQKKNDSRVVRAVSLPPVELRKIFGLQKTAVISKRSGTNYNPPLDVVAVSIFLKRTTQLTRTTTWTWASPFPSFNDCLSMILFSRHVFQIPSVASKHRLPFIGPIFLSL